MLKVKNEKVYFDGEWVDIFQKYRLFIPSFWQMNTHCESNELSFKSNELNNTWEAHFILIEDSTLDCDIFELLTKVISNRHIQFDEVLTFTSKFIEFKDSSLIKSNRYEVVRFEGSATFLKRERHYYDVVIWREKATGSYLYAESKGTILNGFTEALSFERAIIGLEFNE